jgi:phosphoribosylaminoimidazole (AIR) synthetase
MQAIARMADVSEKDAYTHWNMGNGFLIIAPSESVDAILGMAATMGYRAQVAGTINTNTAQIRIGKTVYENPGK